MWWWWWPLGEIASCGLVGLAVLPGKRTATLLGVAPVAPGRRTLAWLGAAFTLAFSLLMTAFVFGQDTYTNDGRSRWATRGSGEHSVYFTTMGVAGFFIALFVLLGALRARGWAIRPVLVAGGVLGVILGGLLAGAFANN